MQRKKVYLTFEANEEMNIILRETAHLMNLTQPKLIYKILEKFYNELNDICETEETNEMKIKKCLEKLKSLDK